MPVRIFYASQCGASMNSNVYEGGGDDDTEALQTILDRAPALGRLHLVLDGAARTTKSLRIHANTTIECPDKSCGIFLSDGANTSILSNANPDLAKIRDLNISLYGGVYNHNSPGQDRSKKDETAEHLISKWVFAMEFHGVAHILFRDVTIANQRTFALLMSNFEHVTMENIHIDRRARADHQNQDGLHFWGPGKFLNLRNIRGNSGDDFIALAPDENDHRSSITDVLIDGVQLDDADQGIRLLSRGEGRLDRVVIRNVTGTYRSYGFIVNPWFDGPGGRFGNIVFDTIDLRPLKNNYTYSAPFLFKLGGRIENLTIRNLYHHRPEHSHVLLIAGGNYLRDEPETPEKPSDIANLMIQGLTIDETDENGVEDVYIRVKSHVESLTVQDVLFKRSGSVKGGGTFIQLDDDASVENLHLRNVILPDSLGKMIEVRPGAIHHFHLDTIRS